MANQELEKRLPAGVELDLYEGTAWLGLVPFMMSGVMRRPFPDMPYFSAFPELNLRTYVVVDGKPGVWFFSLDAHSYPIVIGGRALYNLPYHYAQQKLSKLTDGHEFQSQRKSDSVSFHARYRPTAKEFFAIPGTFEHWATERYCLYSMSGDRELQRVDVHHVAWPLQSAEVEIFSNDIIDATGIPVSSDIPRCHYSRGVHVVSYEKQSCGEKVDMSV
ncbi:DUF2071 domain-containing protein [Persicirhabdus sediminis]|uniref:DUF2071 domain-containing protein n=1 Tax=Persicirhabdus sediminis TaxID=454144 RepID=A0A8J7MER3_9BACT|nr:DUF2071 domain-containing protein [Persicirhabdus sediminis]